MGAVVINYIDTVEELSVERRTIIGIVTRAFSARWMNAALEGRIGCCADTPSVGQQTVAAETR